MQAENKTRIASIDLLRGIVIVLMTLDHVRWFFHADAALHNPLDLETTTPLLYFTRWVTHFCAPVFIFLAGLSAFLFQQKKGKPDAVRFLWTRGLWLIALELVVFRLGWDYHYLRPGIELLIIWVIGITMVVFSLVLRLPDRWMLPIGLFILLTHNLLQQVKVPPESTGYIPWVFFYQGGGFPLPGGSYMFTLYSFYPYLGMICLGFATGRLYRADFPAERRQKILRYAGFAALLLFVLLRWSKLYGDPKPWSAQKDGLFTFLSFINATKYPTSLLYSLMTIGPALLFLSVTENARSRISLMLSQLGAVPMFFFITHLFLIQALALFGAWMFKGRFAVQQFGLAGVYVAFAIVLVALYPLCVRYGKYKSAHPEKHWLAYF